jgi:hypothetical protein
MRLLLDWLLWKLRIGWELIEDRPLRAEPGGIIFQRKYRHEKSGDLREVYRLVRIAR